MYHPTRGGVRGGRDQFNWDDVKVDKHRENYLGHSIKAPVGRWQKGKDLHWYARGKNSGSNDDALKEEIRRIKEEEEQAMREALGLAPKRANKSFGNRLDKHEYAELIKRDSTAEDLGAGHAEAAQVQGLGFSRGPRSVEKPSLPLSTNTVEKTTILPAPTTVAKNDDEVSDDEKSIRKRKHEEKKHDKDEKRDKREKRDKYERHEKRRSLDSEDIRKHRKDKEKKRYD